MPSSPSLTPGRIRLYSGPLSMFGAKAQIAALEKGIDHEVVMVPFDFHALYTPKHPDVLRINPKAQVPVLIHGEVEIFDSTQIFEYFEDIAPEPPLWPRTASARAEARLLEHLSDEVYFPHIIRLMSLQEELNRDAAQAAIAGAEQFCRQHEARLAGRDWLAGEYSFADIAFFMATLFGDRLGAPLHAGLPRLLAWRGRMMQRPPVLQVAGAMGRWLAAVGRPVPAFLRDV